MRNRADFPVFKYYSSLSLLCSALLWAAYYIAYDFAFEKMFFPSTLVFINYHMTDTILRFGEKSLQQKDLGIYIFAQTLCLMALNIPNGRYALDFSYLSIIPILFLMSLIQYSARPLKNLLRSKATTLFLIFMMAHWIFRSFQSRQLDVFESMIFLIFAFFSTGMVYILSGFNSYDMRKAIYKIHDLKSEKDEIQTSDNEQYFFHDIINFTHGLLLFLNTRKRKNEQISPRQVDSLIKEIEQLQLMLKEYFGHHHKNLPSNKKEYVSFHGFKDQVESLIFQFLDKDHVHLTYRGFTRNGTNEDGEFLQVYFPYFSRILVNLVKNIADHAGKEASEVIFDANNEYLTIIVKNRLFKTIESEDLAFDLKNHILNSSTTNTSSHGLGLESIHSLAKQMQGDFHFFVDQGHWVGKVEIKAVYGRDDAENDNFFSKVA